jgi:radical SAM superfamily enzyme YgiQ (UPF0313 family)
MRVLVQTLRDRGHDVKRVRLFRAAEDADQQLALFERTTEKVVDHTWLAKPDAWFVSVLYVRQYVELREMFERMGVPMRTADRSPSDPLVAMGGQFSIAPEPLAEFADVIALGDGELTGTRIADMLRAGAGRLDIMRDLHGVQGFYVPSRGVAPFVRWESEKYAAVSIEDGAPTIELARGCASKCAFCRIGWAGGTYREAPQEQVVKALSEHAGGRVNIFAPDYSSVSWVEDLERAVSAAGCRSVGRDARADATHRLLKSGAGAKSYSFGVEGLSERLRAAVGKPLSSSKLTETMAMLDAAEVRSVKWYMLFGLPGEGAADLEEFIKQLDASNTVFSGALTVTAGQYKALPHTPLERGDNTHRADASERFDGAVKWAKEWKSRGLTGKRIVAGYKGRELHEWECVLLRSGREAAGYIERAKASEIASGRWRDRGLNLDVLAEIPEDAPTAWDHVIAGPPRDVRRKALDTYWRTLRKRPLPILQQRETTDAT